MNIFLTNNVFMLLAIIIFWVLPWKGYALWLSAHNKHKRWFIIFLILNTFAILEIVYVFYIVKKNTRDILEDIKSKV